MEECLGQLVSQLVATGVSGSSPRFTQELLQDKPLHGCLRMIHQMHLHLLKLHHFFSY